MTGMYRKTNSGPEGIYNISKAFLGGKYEVKNAQGFNLYVSESPDDKGQKVNSEPLPVLDSFLIHGLIPGKTYYLSRVIVKPDGTEFARSKPVSFVAYPTTP